MRRARLNLKKKIYTDRIMPYYRKKTYTKRRPRKSRKVITSRKRVNTLSLARKVAVLAKKQRGITEKCQYTQSWDNNISQNYFAQPLVSPTNWSSVFGQSENVVESKKINLTKVNIDWLLSPGRESAQIDYTVFLISPRTHKVFNETTGLTAFQNNPNGQQDYTTTPITFMSPKRFKIWKVWRVQTSGITTRVDGNITPTTNVVNTNHYARRYFKMSFKRYMRNTQSLQSWQQITDSDIPISCSLGLVAFNNNSAVDVENPNFKGTALFSCYC